jgi:hypothetical protein
VWGKGFGGVPVVECRGDALRFGPRATSV